MQIADGGCPSLAEAWSMMTLIAINRYDSLIDKGLL